jgi:hypothetical protein
MDFAFEDGRDRFSVGEPIAMRVSVTNCADEVRSLQYTTNQRYDLVVSSATNAREIWRSSSGQIFEPAQGEEEFEPGETKTYTEVWDQKGESGEQAPVDNYNLEAHALPCESANIADCEANTVISIAFEIRSAN